MGNLVTGISCLFLSFVSLGAIKYNQCVNNGGSGNNNGGNGGGPMISPSTLSPITNSPITSSPVVIPTSSPITRSPVVCPNVDNEPPKAICKQNIQVRPFTYLSRYMVDNGSWDECGISHYVVDYAGFYKGFLECNDLGGQVGISCFYTCNDHGTTYDIRLIVQDSNGNTAECITTITPIDDIPPFADCEEDAVVVYVDESTGIATVTINDVDGGQSYDNCGIYDATVTPNTFDCNDVNRGFNVNVVYEDVNLNTQSCNAAVIVRDTDQPKAKCHDTITIAIQQSGIATIEPNQVDNGSTYSVCWNINYDIEEVYMSLSQTILSCFNVGYENYATLTYEVIYWDYDLCEYVETQDTCQTEIMVIDPNGYC